MTEKAAHQAPSLFDWNIVGPAIGNSFKKLDPRLMVKNPVMFVTMVGAILTTVAIFTATADRGFIAQLAVWLWFTVLFANFAEAVAEGRGKAQADSLRKARKTTARRLKNSREASAGNRPAKGRSRRLRSRRHHSGGRRSDRGHSERG
jgi:K+-transporting ATPase ATPase B chain